MKKRYIFGIVTLVIVVIFLCSVLFSSNNNIKFGTKSNEVPRIGQSLWIYNIKTHKWKKSDNPQKNELDENEVELKIDKPDTNLSSTIYSLNTINDNVTEKDFVVGENSIEFLRGNNLFTFLPKSYEYDEIIFNGAQFRPRKLSDDEIKTIFKSYKIIHTSELKKDSYKIKASKTNNNYIIINDMGDKFYQYYIIPNDSTVLQIGEFANQFKVTGKTTINLQRLEGCSKNYPCYKIEVE